MKPDLRVLLIRNSFDQRTGEFDDDKQVDSSMKYLPKPIGLLYLKAALENRSVPCEVLDLNSVKQEKREELCRQSSRGYSHVGFSAMTCGVNSSLKYARIMKDENPDLKVVFGGPHATYATKELLVNKTVDFVVRGEGDRVLVDLVLDGPESVCGVAFRRGREIIDQGIANIQDLDQLPIVSRAIEGRDYRYTLAESIYVSRGCIGKCSFCVESRMFSQRFRSMNSIERELQGLKDTGVRKIYFEDSNMFNKRGFIAQLVNLLKRKRWGFDIANMHMSVEGGDPSMIPQLKEVGVQAIEIGIETLNREALLYLGKTKQPEKYVTKAFQLMEACKSCGMELDLNLLMPCKGQTKESVRSEFERLQQYGTPMLYLLAPYPGTPLWDSTRGKLLKQDYGFFDSENLVINESSMTRAEIEELWKFAKFTVEQKRRLFERYN